MTPLKEDGEMILYLLPFAAFLLGSVPVGLLLVRRTHRIDVRRTGSGNIGATNVWRSAGMGLGIVTLLADALKGALPAFAALHLDAPSWYATAVGLAAILGHMFPLFLGLKPGGKGVATAAGVFSVLAPPACAIALSVFILVALTTHRVSVGSLAGAAALPPALWLTVDNPFIFAGGLAAMVLILVRHHENIQRLRQGKEPPFNS